VGINNKIKCIPLLKMSLFYVFKICKCLGKLKTKTNIVSFPTFVNASNLKSEF